jgi:hypothetical protein
VVIPEEAVVVPVLQYEVHPVAADPPAREAEVVQAVPVPAVAQVLPKEADNNIYEL